MSRPTPPADTAWARFETARGLSAGAHARTLRRLELHAPRLNLDAATVGLAGEIASLAPEVDPTALTLLVLISLADTTRGSTRTPLRRAHIERHLMALLGPVDPARSEPRTTEVLAVAHDPAAAAVIGTRSTDYTPLIRQDGHLYQQRLLVAEAHLAELLGERLMQPRPPLSADALADVWARPTLRNGTPIELSEEQKRAVSTSACGALTLISGGPGTGKTSIVVALLRGLVRGGVDPRSVALAAPTGKAAWRMGHAEGQQRVGAQRRQRDAPREEAPPHGGRGELVFEPGAHLLHGVLGGLGQRLQQAAGGAVGVMIVGAVGAEILQRGAEPGAPGGRIGGRLPGVQVAKQVLTEIGEAAQQVCDAALHGVEGHHPTPGRAALVGHGAAQQ